MATVKILKSDFVRARIEPKLKADVHSVFHKLGVTPTQVINMLYKRIKHEHRIPFELSLPNAQTTKAIKEARKRKGIVENKNAEDMFKKLRI